MPPPEYLAEALVVDIAALKKPLILVLDDFNNIVSEPVHTIVTWAIENLPGRGWSIGTTPIMNYDWKNEEWTIPLNLTTSKTLKIGKTPLKLELEANYYVAQPDAFGPQWMLGLNVTPVVPNFIDRWIHGQ